jgi:hypothetical protein
MNMNDVSTISSDTIQDALCDGIDEFLRGKKEIGILNVSRESVISYITERLRKYMDENRLDDKRILITSGIAIGMAMVLVIDDKLSD